MAFDPVSGLSLASVSSDDQEKFLHAKLLERAYLKLVASSVCDKIKQPKGTGTTAYFVRYKRMKVPLTTLTEGTAPSNSAYSLETVTVTLDQWGDVISISDIARLTTKHNLWSEVMELLLDNAERVIDREVQAVWLAGTNVMYGDGSVTSRAAVTAAMTMTQAILHKVRITMSSFSAGAKPRFGPSNMKENAKGGPATGNLLGKSHYLAITNEEVLSDLMSIAAPSGLWQAVSTYQDKMAIYNGEIGQMLGFRFVTTNFIPKFEILGNTTAAVASGGNAGVTGLTITAVDGGGSLTSATTYYYKFVRIDRTRGFSELISIEHTTASAATGNNESFTFAWPSSTDYAYQLYFGSSTGDANLKLVNSTPAIGGTTTTVTAVPSSTTTAPANVNTTGTPDINLCYFFGANACAWVGLQELETHVTEDKATKSDPLNQTRTMGYKFMGKTVILDQNRILRWEGASAFN